MQNSQANLPRLKHLAARTAQALLTLTSSCVLNYINTLRPVCPGEMLQLNVHLRASPSLGLGPPSKAGGSSSKAGLPPGCPRCLAFALTLRLTSGLGSPRQQGGPRADRGPIPPCLLQKQQQWSASPGRAEEFSGYCYCQGGLVASQELKSQDSAPAAAVVKPSS